MYYIVIMTNQKLTNFKQVGETHLYDSHHDETFNKFTGEVVPKCSVVDYLRKDKKI